MRHIIVIGVLSSSLLAGLSVSGQGFSAAKETALDTSYLRVYAETRGFMLGRPVKPKPTPDGKAILFLRSPPRLARLDLYEFDVATAKTRELLTTEKILHGAEEQLSAEEKARRERMAAPKSIAVGIDSPKVTMRGAEQATISFRQTYKSDKLKSQSRKTLELVKTDGHWLIKEEKAGK